MDKRLYLLLLLVIPFALWQTVQGEIIVDVGNILWDSGTAFRATLDHAITANRVFTFPDATTTIVGTDVAQTLTSKTINADSNTITNIENADIKAGADIDAAKLGTGVVDTTEFNSLNGVSGSAVDDGANIGSGAGTIFSSKVGNDLQFKTIRAGAGVTLTNYANNVLVNSTGGVTTFESLTNVTDVGCATGQVRKASGGQWVCANDDNSGGTPLFNSTVSYIVNTDGTNCFVINGTTGDIDSQSNDCEVQIEYAIQNRNANRMGIVQLGPGTFNINDAINITNNMPLWLKGSGIEATTLKLTNGANDQIIHVRPTSPQIGLAITDMELDGNQYNQVSPPSDTNRDELSVLMFGNNYNDNIPAVIKDVRLENLWVHDGRTGACIRVIGVDGLYENNVRIEWCGVPDTLISDCQWTGFSNKTRISNSIFHHCTDVGLANAHVYDGVVSNSIATQNNHTGFGWSKDSKRGIFNGLIAFNNTLSGGQNRGMAIQNAGGSQSERLIITNSWITNNTVGIIINDANNAIIQGNYFEGNTNNIDDTGSNSDIFIGFNFGLLETDYPIMYFMQKNAGVITAVDTGVPELNMLDPTTTPPLGTVLGNLDWEGMNDAGVKEQYARTQGLVRDDTAGGEDGHMKLQVAIASTLTSFLELVGDTGLIEINKIMDFNSNNVTSIGKIREAMGCSNGQILEYSTAQGSWECGTDDGGGGGFTGSGLTFADASKTFYPIALFNGTDNLNSTNLVYFDASTSSAFITKYATTGPALNLFRNQSGLASSSTIGILDYRGINDAGTDKAFNRLIGALRDKTTGDESGSWKLQVLENGTQTTYSETRGDLGLTDLTRPLRLNILTTATLPGCDAGFEGSIVYDDTTNTIKWCNGSAWATI